MKTAKEVLEEALSFDDGDRPCPTLEESWRTRISQDEAHYVNLAGDQYIGFVSCQLAHEMVDEMVKPKAPMKDAIIEILKKHTREMEGYGYFVSNPGVAEYDYEDVAEEIKTLLTTPTP